MKYCSNCGTQLVDEAIVCTGCGCAVNTAPIQKEISALKTVAKVFMIIGCISLAFSLIPLCWAIPMTVHYCNAIKNNKRIDIGFKICTLLFVNIVAGIIMLCDQD